MTIATLYYYSDYLKGLFDFSKTLDVSLLDNLDPNHRLVLTDKNKSLTLRLRLRKGAHPVFAGQRFCVAPSYEGKKYYIVFQEGPDRRKLYYGTARVTRKAIC